MPRARSCSTPSRSPSSERFDESWYPGESVVTSLFAEQGGRTAVTMTMLFESQEARDGVLKSGMEGGVAQSYDRLAEILDSPQILQTSAQPVALLRLTVPRAETQKVMGPGLQELMAVVAAQGGDEHSRRRPRASSSGLKRLRYRRRVRS